MYVERLDRKYLDRERSKELILEEIIQKERNGRRADRRAKLSNYSPKPLKYANHIKSRKEKRDKCHDPFSDEEEQNKSKKSL